MKGGVPYHDSTHAGQWPSSEVAQTPSPPLVPGQKPYGGAPFVLNTKPLGIFDGGAKHGGDMVGTWSGPLGRALRPTAEGRRGPEAHGRRPLWNIEITNLEHEIYDIGTEILYETCFGHNSTQNAPKSMIPGRIKKSTTFPIIWQCQIKIWSTFQKVTFLDSQVLFFTDFCPRRET